MSCYTLFTSKAVLCATLIIAPVDCAQPDNKPKSFPVAKVRFEQNATDGDVEVVFEVTGRRQGLTSLRVEAPDGRLVVDFESEKSKSGATASGIRQFVFESPEPRDVASLKASFPEGNYTFEGSNRTSKT